MHTQKSLLVTSVVPSSPYHQILMVLEHIWSQERLFLSVLVSKPVIVFSDIWTQYCVKTTQKNTTQHTSTVIENKDVFVNIWYNIFRDMQTSCYNKHHYLQRARNAQVSTQEWQWHLWLKHHSNTKEKFKSKLVKYTIYIIWMKTSRTSCTYRQACKWITRCWFSPGWYNIEGQPQKYFSPVENITNVSKYPYNIKLNHILKIIFMFYTCDWAIFSITSKHAFPICKPNKNMAMIYRHNLFIIN